MPYRGLIGADDTNRIDTAYRIVVDHMRMMVISLADGLRPGNRDLELEIFCI